MRLILIVLFILSCLFVPLKTVYAEGQMVFSDNFSDGTLDGWNIESGNWYINLGNLAGSKSGTFFGGRVNNGLRDWENYSLELDFNIQSGIDAGVGFKYTPNISGYEINLRAGTGIFNTPQIILRKNQAGVVSVVGDTHTFPLVNGKWYHLKLEVSGENIKVWIADTLVFDITDQDTQVTKGGITLSYWTGALGVVYTRFDNVVVTSLAPPPPAKTPLIIIPGIGGSELKVNQDTIWLKDDGHGGEYNRAYLKDEKVWVNEGEAAKPGDDDYFDILRMKEDGVTSEVDMGIGGSLVMRAYGEAVKFFEDNNYTLNQDLFIFLYDWRRDLSETSQLLDQKIQQIKEQTGSDKVDIISHSMGGLVARNYIADTTRAQNVRKLFALGTPHLGAVDFLKAMRYGICLIEIGPLCPILAISEVKDVVQNMISGYQLAPSQIYFNFYSDEDNSHPYPYRTEYGTLNYLQIQNLLTALGHNTSLFNPSETFHSMDSTLDNTNGVDVIVIAGSGQLTLGQIVELKAISLLGTDNIKRDIRIINGDKTVPLFSASLNDPSKNLSLLGSARVYYTNQKHDDLVITGPALNLVKNILEEKNELPDGVSNQPYPLPLLYRILSVHSPVNIHVFNSTGNHTGSIENGDFEANIPGGSYDTLGDAKFIYLPDDGVYSVKFEATDNGSFDFKIREFEDGINSETILYKEIPLTNNTKAETVFDTTSDQHPTVHVDENGDGIFDFDVERFSVLEGNTNNDYTPPEISFDVNPKSIWPPNGKMVDVNIKGSIVDENPYLIRVLVDDEYDLIEPSITNYYQTEFNQTIKLEASRKEEDQDGRTYTVKILVTDLAGNTSFATAEVIIPHDQSEKK